MEAGLAAGLTEAEAASIEACYRARLRMYLPGGPMALELSKNATVLVVNDTAFAHGGLLPMHGAPGRRPFRPSSRATPSPAFPPCLRRRPPSAAHARLSPILLPYTPSSRPYVRPYVPTIRPQSSTGWSG